MNETLGKLSEQITTFLDKFDKKQKLKIFGVAALVIATLAILIIVLNQPKMVLLSDNLSTKQAADIRDLLQENNITYEVAEDGTRIDVDSKQIADAKMILGQNGIPSTGFTYEDAFNSSFSTTETEKQQKYQLAFEQELSESISTMDGISDAIVKLVMADEDRTIFDENKLSKASAIITTEYDISSEQVQGIVNFLAASVNNLEPENIRIIDQKGNVLYLGEEDDVIDNFGTQYEYVNERSAQIKRDVMAALLGTGLYDDAEVVVNLVVDFDKEASVSENYSTPEGQTNGIPQSSYHYESTGVNTGATGTPGTDANDETTQYMMTDENSSESETVIDQIEYNVNKTTTTTEKSLGKILYDDSSIGVVLNQYRIYDEEVLEEQGLLEDMTFEEFKEQNMEQNVITIDEEMVEMVRSATGIQNVNVIGYEVPIFYSKSSQEGSWTNYILLGLTILIVALLAFVVYKGTEAVEVTEIAPELSVEDMLATTREQQLDDIEFDDKSETRKHIEKFVEEKPDAVAQLLRNWLNEDWE